MRIRVRHKPAASHWGATLLKNVEPGLQYAVDDSLGLLVVGEGWAEAVTSEEPALVIPLREMFLVTLDDAIASDIAFDDAIAAAIERRHVTTNDLRMSLGPSEPSARNAKPTTVLVVEKPQC